LTRVVITGIGLVTSIGGTRAASWQAMLEGRCGIGPVTVFDPKGFRSTIAAEVDLGAVTSSLTPLERRRWSRADQIGVVAADEAIADSGLLEGADRTRVGVLLGAGTADLIRNERYHRTLVRGGGQRPRPSDAWNHFASTVVDLIAERHQLEGMRSCIAAACASSTIAIGQGLDAIRAGRLDAALVGGSDALARLTFSGFNALRVMDPEPCRPFDRGRAGMNIGEGAAILVLESYERARRRGARIHAEVAGYSLSCEAYHPTAPEPEGHAIAALVQSALRDARVDPSAVQHVNAHGTATPQNDVAEARGFRRAFGERSSRLPVTSIKSMVGHCLGAAGGFVSAAAAWSIACGVIPPTIHVQEPDPECPVDVVANEAREVPLDVVVSTSLGFGGNDAAVVLRGI
jgi:3-oxoacyl-[acyl-carrier-protein] synthase II